MCPDARRATRPDARRATRPDARRATRPDARRASSNARHTVPNACRAMRSECAENRLPRR